MKFFALFIYRPVATILLVAITLCGILGFRMLPVAPLPQVDFPVIMVSASLPGAWPETIGVFRCHAAGALTWAHCRGQ
ncbi:efflux RND transporter permease subunit [Escherichia coli]